MRISIASYSFHGLTGAGMMDIFGYLESVKYRYRLDAADIWSGTLGSIEPEHLGKLNFYLEALDRDARKPHETPAIGVLLCASKDNEVVEYALSRSLSPALIAEYQRQLPDKDLLQAKLHELYQRTLDDQTQASPAPASKVRKRKGGQP